MFLQFKIYDFKGHQVKIGKIKSKNKTKPFPYTRIVIPLPRRKTGQKIIFNIQFFIFN